MDADHLLKNASMRVVSDVAADPTEFFNHYDAFAFWICRKISPSIKGRKILDLGGRKSVNSILSIYNEVSSIVLADCHDSLSNTRYVIHDVSYQLPFEDNSFDVFTSTVSLHLIGLGRYGDRFDPNCLPNFIKEINRVLRPNSELYFSICLGPDRLAFNNGWILSLDTVSQLFKGWKIAEIMVDHWSSPKNQPDVSIKERFSNNTEFITSMRPGDYKIGFFHFTRTSMIE